VQEALIKTVGLVGDGDDLAALEEVEREFGVSLREEDAPHWRTAGDLFASLVRVLPADVAGDAATWTRFAQALCRENGTDPHLISEMSPLFLPDLGFWGVSDKAA
jgi:hypothetical protein